MRVSSKTRLRAFWEDAEKSDAEGSLRAWYSHVSKPAAKPAAKPDGQPDREAQKSKSKRTMSDGNKNEIRA